MGMLGDIQSPTVQVYALQIRPEHSLKLCEYLLSGPIGALLAIL